MELSIQKIAVICFFLIGLSHVSQPRVWVQFFTIFRNQGESGSFLIAFLHFPLGALIVSFHNVWRGIPLVLTVMGWGFVLKGLIYFAFPKYGVRMLSRMSPEKAWAFHVAGVLFIAISALLTFSLFTS